MKNVLGLIAVAALLAACSSPVASGPQAGISDRAVAPGSSGVSSATYYANGEIQFKVVLASGQQYVEIFVRRNGVQEIAQNIVASERVNGDGTSTYSYNGWGYTAADYVEFRFYSYLPNQGGVFTPGPYENVWSHQVVYPAVLTLPVLKDASLIGSSYGVGYGGNTNFGSAPTVDVASYHHQSSGLFGFSLGALPANVAIVQAKLVFRNVVSVSGQGSVALSVVDDSTSWSESTVTLNTAPSATSVGTYQFPSSGSASIDVTNLVSTAAIANRSEISFLLTAGQGNFFIDSKENSSGLSAQLVITTTTSAPELTGFVETRWYVQDQILRSCTLFLSWTVPPGFEYQVDHYEIDTSTDGGATWTVWTNVSSPMLNVSWTPGLHATFSVFAVDTQGRRSARSNVLNL